MGVTQMWKIVKDAVILAIESCIPKVKIRSGKTHPLWVNNEMMVNLKKETGMQKVLANS